MRFSIGTDDFKRIRTDKDEYGQLCFYCDKSLLIRDVINDGSEVIVLPRPKRFGKTLNLSMLRYFFDVSQNNADLFQGLEIAEHQNIMENWQGKYPVIFISFKDLRADNYTLFVEYLKQNISECYQNFKYLLDSSVLDSALKEKLASYLDENFKAKNIKESLWYLTKALHEHHGQKVIVLMDEYDTPLQDAYMNTYFDKAIKPFRAMMGKVFKGNEFLYKGVITGITRIAKESLFSGVNNLDVFDITRNRYAEYFGFREKEVQAICPPEHLEDLKSWYNGYTFGDDLTIYNPWSILKFCSNDYKLDAYWINTSTNELIRDTLTPDKLQNVKTLMEGGSLAIEIEPFTVMDNLKTNPNSFWNLLFMAGYLTLDHNKHMRIPNQEVLHFFEKIVMGWFGGQAENSFINELLDDLIQGYIQSLQKKLSKLILETFSCRDVEERKQEAFYHGFLLGVTLGLRGRYTVKSNRESGFGFYDIALYPNNPAKDPGIVIEVKAISTASEKEGTKSKKKKGPDRSADGALNQIKDRAYATELKQLGCKIIFSYGISFDGKHVSTKLVTERF